MLRSGMSRATKLRAVARGIFGACPPIFLSGAISCVLTLYDPGGGFKSPPLRSFALTHLILELHYCALGTFPKKFLTPYGEKKFSIGGHDLAGRGVLKYKVDMIFIIFREFNTMLEIIDS